MSDELFTVHGAAEKLRRDRRIVRRALNGVMPDDAKDGRQRWRLDRVTRALAAYDAGWQDQTGRSIGDDRRRHECATAIHRACLDLEARLAQLAREPDMEKRLAMATVPGGLREVGALDRAFEAAQATCSDVERELYQPFVDNVMRKALAMVADCLKIRITEEGAVRV